MPAVPRPLPEQLPHPVFTTVSAAAAGLSRERLRRGDLRRVARGLYAVRGVDITEAAIIAAYCHDDPEVFATGLSAARLWDMPLPRDIGRPVTQPISGSRERIRGALVVDPEHPERITPAALVHLSQPTMPRADSALVHWRRSAWPTRGLLRVTAKSGVSSGAGPRGAAAGEREPSAKSTTGQRTGLVTLRVAPRLDTFLSLGTLLPVDRLVEITDHLVRRPRWMFENRDDPYVRIEDLRAAVAAYRGRGAIALREAAALARVGADSPPETRLRLAFIRAGLGEPQLNIPISDDWRLGTPDLQYRRWKVAIEYQGPSHLEPGQRQTDITCSERRRKAGWIVLEMMSRDLAKGCASAVSRTTEALRAQGWPG